MTVMETMGFKSWLSFVRWASFWNLTGLVFPREEQPMVPVLQGHWGFQWDSRGKCSAQCWHTVGTS